MIKQIILLCLVLLIILSCVNSIHTKKDETINTIVSASQKQTTVNWMTKWPNRKSKRNLIESAAREFEFLNQDIFINMKYDEEVCNNCTNVQHVIQDTIIQMIQKKSYNWDIIIITMGDYNTIGEKLNDPYWGRQYLVNFEEFDWFKESHIDLVFKNPQYRDDFGGIMAGPLIEGRYFSLWYNIKVAERLGIKIKPSGMNFEDFISYLKQGFEYNKMHTEKIKLFVNNAPVINLFSTFVLSDLGNEDIENASLVRKLSALKRALDACEEISKYNPLDESIVYTPIYKDPILDENSLFTSAVSSSVNNWEFIDPEKALNMFPAEYPIFENRVKYYKGNYQSVWGVMKNAPHCNEAIKIMKFLCSNDIAERWLTNTKNPTALKVRINASDVGKDELDKFNAYIATTYGDNIINYDIVTLLFGNKTTIEIDPTDVIAGKITAEDYYKQILKQFRK